MNRDTSRTVTIQRVEGAAIAVLSWVVLIHADLAWWWPIALFLVFDVSALGYLSNPRIGAIGYNAVHALVGPLALAATALAINSDVLGTVVLAWLIHIGVDRALGYGLKEPDAFGHTHLGWAGRKP